MGNHWSNVRQACRANHNNWELNYWARIPGISAMKIPEFKIAWLESFKIHSPDAFKFRIENWEEGKSILEILVVQSRILDSQPYSIVNPRCWCRTLGVPSIAALWEKICGMRSINWIRCIFIACLLPPSALLICASLAFFLKKSTHKRQFNFPRCFWDAFRYSSNSLKFLGKLNN